MAKKDEALTSTDGHGNDVKAPDSTFYAVDNDTTTSDDVQAQANQMMVDVFKKNFLKIQTFSQYRSETNFAAWLKTVPNLSHVKYESAMAAHRKRIDDLHEMFSTVEYVANDPKNPDKLTPKVVQLPIPNYGWAILDSHIAVAMGEIATVAIKDRRLEDIGSATHSRSRRDARTVDRIISECKRAGFVSGGDDTLAGDVEALSDKIVFEWKHSTMLRNALTTNKKIPNEQLKEDLDPLTAAKVIIAVLRLHGRNPGIYGGKKGFLTWFDAKADDGPYIPADNIDAGDQLTGPIVTLLVAANPAAKSDWMKEATVDIYRILLWQGAILTPVKKPAWECWAANGVCNTRTKKLRPYTVADVGLGMKLAAKFHLADDGETVVAPEMPVRHYDVVNMRGRIIERDAEYTPQRLINELSTFRTVDPMTGKRTDRLNDDVVDAIFQVFSYVARHMFGEQATICGEGGKGKSTVIAEGIRAMCGEGRTSKVPMEEFGVASKIISMVGKAANVSDESAIDAHINLAVLRIWKTLVDGGTETVDRKFLSAADVTGDCPHVQLMNKVPTFGERDASTHRRQKFIPTSNIKPNRKVKALRDEFVRSQEFIDWMLYECLFGREGRNDFEFYQENPTMLACRRETMLDMSAMNREWELTCAPMLDDLGIISIEIGTVSAWMAADMKEHSDPGKLPRNGFAKQLEEITNADMFDDGEDADDRDSWVVIWRADGKRPMSMRRAGWDQSYLLRPALLKTDYYREREFNGKVEYSSDGLGAHIGDRSKLSDVVSTGILIRKWALDECRARNITPEQLYKEQQAAKQAEADAPRIEADAKAKHLEEVDAVKAYEQFLLPNIEVLKPKGLCRPDGSEFWPPSFDEWVATGMRNSFGGDGVNGKKFITPGAGESLLNACGDPIDTGDDPWYCAGIKTGDKVECVGEFVHLPWTRVLANAPDLLAAIRPDGWTEDMPPEPSDGSDEADSGTGTATAPNEP